MLHELVLKVICHLLPHHCVINLPGSGLCCGKQPGLLPVALPWADTSPRVMQPFGLPLLQLGSCKLC